MVYALASSSHERERALRLATPRHVAFCCFGRYYSALTALHAFKLIIRFLIHCTRPLCAWFPRLFAECCSETALSGFITVSGASREIKTPTF